MTAAFLAFLGEARRRPFVWGRHDCALFLSDWCLALTGRDPSADLRGRYFDEAHAAEWIRREGGFVRMVGSRLGWPERAAGASSLGDGAVLVLPGGKTAAVRGPDAWWSLSPRGIARIAEAPVLKVWQCPS